MSEIEDDFKSAPVQWRYRIFDLRPLFGKGKPRWSEWLDANYYECGNYEGLVQFRRKPQ